ncbi:MAG TPA: DUF3352 domain-containing protein [Pyrinomonadaceae bacterium]
MKSLKCFLPLVCLFSIFFLPPAALGQQRRQQPRPNVKPTAAEQITFDTLLGTDRYKIYAEARSVGQLIRSNSVNELLEPVMKLAGPPQEFRKFIKWIDAHSEDVMTSRILLATWPIAPNLPDAVFAIEFDSSEEASKFLPQLNTFLPKVLPPQPAPSPSPNDQKPPGKSEDAAPVKSSFFLKQMGSLIIISSGPINLKDLRPSASKLLADQPSFRVARNRFTSEQIFVYVDVNSIEKEDEERRKQYEEDEKKRAEEKANAVVISEASPSPQEGQGEASPEEQRLNPAVEVPTADQSAIPVPTPDPLTTAVGMIFNSFFISEAKWPDGIGVGISFEHDSFDVRALLVSAPGERCDVVPFVPNLKVGSPIVPESPSILPADTELFATLSLDLPQILTAMNRMPLSFENPGGPQRIAAADPSFLPVARVEAILKINIREELLPLLGQEVVISMPVSFLEDGPRRTAVPPNEVSTSQSTQPEQTPSSAPPIVVALSLKDREGMKTLLPKIVESLGFKGIGSLTQTEHREDTEVVSYGSFLSYAFIGNFLVVSNEPKAIRHVVDSYLKHETLSSDPQFKNYTRWQPRQLQAQLYISPALMQSYKRWAEEPSSLISDQTREFLLRLTAVPQPISYALSNDGLGILHEVHVPKDFILTAVAAMSAESNPSPMISNERGAITALHMIANVEAQYRSGEGQGSFASLDTLIESQMISKEIVENHGYKIEITLSGNKFEATATPLEYGKTGKTSYYIDDSNVLRGADHGGASASAADKPI